MKRSALMRKAPMRRNLPPPRPVKQLDYTPRPRAAAVAMVDAPARACVPVPKGEKAKPGKRAPTADERRWLDAIVAYGCVACRLDGNGVVAPAVHHILRGGLRMGHRFTLPLCDPGHHQGGEPMGMVSRHPWKARFEAKYGSEEFLLRKIEAEIGDVA